MNSVTANILERNRKNFYENGGCMYKYNVSEDVRKNAVNFFESVMEPEEKKPDKNVEIKAFFKAQVEQIEKEIEKAKTTLNLKKVGELENLVSMLENKIAELEKQDEEPQKNEDEDFLNMVKQKAGITE